MICGRPFLAKAPTLGGSPPGAPILDGLHGLSPSVPECWNHLGDSLFQQRRLNEALACYAEAAARGGDPAARGDKRWMSLKMLGRFEHAWQVSDELERIHRACNGGASCHVWDGSLPDGRDVFVRCCHGLGDTLQFIRYIPLLRPRCRSLVVQAQRELWPVLRGVEGVGELVPSWEVLPEGLRYDLEIEVMELPYLFRSTVADLPRRVPYLHVDAELIEEKRRVLNALSSKGQYDNAAGRSCRERYSRDGDAAAGGCPARQAGPTDAPGKGGLPFLKIGLVWASSRWNPTRSVPLELFGELAHLTGVQVFSLQWGEEREELRARPGLPIIDLGADAEAIEETAALIMNMDLIVCPDTMLAHLAGALGKPVWVVLLHRADWRWLAAGERSPWYPTMRLFRQPSPGDWASAVGRVTEDIRTLVVDGRNPMKI